MSESPLKYIIQYWNQSLRYSLSRKEHREAITFPGRDTLRPKILKQCDWFLFPLLPLKKKNKHVTLHVRHFCRPVTRASGHNYAMQVNIASTWQKTWITAFVLLGCITFLCCFSILPQVQRGRNQGGTLCLSCVCQHHTALRSPVLWNGRVRDALAQCTAGGLLSDSLFDPID